MINTDEFEGHTPAPWDFADFEPIIVAAEDYEHNEVDWKLIAAAPDLLAEIKRLRENIEGYIAIWDYLDPKGYAWQEEKFVTLLKEHGFDTGDDEE